MKFFILNLLSLVIFNLEASELKVKVGDNIKSHLSSEVVGSVKKDSISYVNFWATWCAPCVQEIPELVELSNKNINANVILVSVDEDRKDAVKFLREKKITLKNVFDSDKKMPDSLGFSTLPYTFVIDSKFTLIKIFRGHQSYKEFVIPLKNDAK